MQNPWLHYLLPLAGLGIVIVYLRFGKNVEAGNKLLIEEIHNPQKTIPLRMTPLVLFGTLATHLFGGSAGREGTAVQMGGSLADQISHHLRLSAQHRKTIIMAGISAGFAAVFGTPFAGAVFGLEILTTRRPYYQALYPCLLSALIADRICLLWGIHHTAFTIHNIPSWNFLNFAATLLAGACFGLCARSFIKLSHGTTDLLKKLFPAPLVRVFWGGLSIVLLTYLLQTDRFLGLGLPTISQSFLSALPPTDFFLKMIFTVITLSSGFKGGEVTPLFFIGATLGNALTWILPLPGSLLAGMGFVAVFAGAANTPLTCIIMALELFGHSSTLFMVAACVVSYFFSGQSSIYHSQKNEAFNHAQKN